MGELLPVAAFVFMMLSAMVTLVVFRFVQAPIKTPLLLAPFVVMRLYSTITLSVLALVTVPADTAIKPASIRLWEILLSLPKIS